MVAAPELVRRAADADPAAWQELVRRYSSVVWSVAREYRLTTCDAADVSQATWLTLAEHLGRLRAPDRLAGWLATTARREALRILAVRRREAPLEWAEGSSIVDGPDVAVVSGDAEGVLWRCLHGMPDRCRALLRLIAHAPDLTYAQAARCLGIRAGSVGPMRSRCLAVLRQRLAGEGVLR
jgi:RNA polymerase sigma factor (sigma-70 family)